MEKSEESLTLVTYFSGWSSLDCLGKNHPDVAALCVKFVKFTFLPAVVIFCFCVYLGEKVKNFKAFKFEPRAFKTWWTFKVSEPPHGTVTKNNNNDNYKLLWCCSRFKTQWCWLVQRAPDITDDWLALMENFVQICFFCYIEVKKDALTIYSFIYLYNYFFKKKCKRKKKNKKKKERNIHQKFSKFFTLIITIIAGKAVKKILHFTETFESLTARIVLF